MINMRDNVCIYEFLETNLQKGKKRESESGRRSRWSSGAPASIKMKISRGSRARADRTGEIVKAAAVVVVAESS